MVIEIYKRVHEVEFELSNGEFETMRRAFAVVRQECGLDLTDDECLVTILERASGSA
jgi:hypothetical protein